jgi:thioredoxin
MMEYADSDFAEFIASKTCLVKFGAEWCGPCRVVAPTLEKVEKETGITVYDVDIDAYSNVAAEYGIRSIPTIIAFKDGNPIDALVGSYDESVYKEFAEKVK